MKDKILYLILGILIGAVITAGCFLVFSKNRAPQMRGGERPDMSNMSEEDFEKLRQKRPDTAPNAQGMPHTNTIDNNSSTTITE